MKMKRFLSGIFAAVMFIVLVATPFSTAIADGTNPPDPNADKCIITITHPATSGTYKAYPIFVGEVEMETGDDGKETGRKLICNLEFHKNMETTINTGAVASRTGSLGYGLYQHLENDTAVGGVKFSDMIKAYDPYTNLESFSMGSKNAPVSKQAETLANILNLTLTNDSSVTTITNGGKSSAFYSAFAEAARNFMVDKITSDDPGTLTNIKEGTLAGDNVTIEVDEPGYYLVEYTPADYDANSEDYEKTPKRVRRSLVLVGKGTALNATIASKDTQNIASVDVQFNETMLVKDDIGTFSYGDKGEGAWAKNVSAGNGDYVNCRVVVTVPANLADYDQYYLAVPIMYGYGAAINSNFDVTKSITRQGSDKENVKVYFLDGENKINIHDTSFTTVAAAGYTYANNRGNNTGGYGNNQDYFIASETFEFKDIANITVDGNLAKNIGYNQLVIEFPVKFDRFSGSKMNDGSLKGVSYLGFKGNTTTFSEYTGDDALLKNYITAKAAYSNNPNLKVLKEDEKNADGTPKAGVHLYLDTTKGVGTLQNPVGIAKESSANIVTYRLRVHVTTEDLINADNDPQKSGVEGVRFVLYDNATKKYAEVEKFTDPTTYDTVDGEVLDGTSPDSCTVNAYKITGWVDDYNTTAAEGGGETTTTTKSECVLMTYKTPVNASGIWGNYYSSRFEIVGLAPGDYTIIDLDKTVKTADTPQGTITANAAKEYSLTKENGNPKTDYHFSFDPILSENCTRLPYCQHYAPGEHGGLSSINFPGNGMYDPDQPNKNSIDTTGLIKDFNIKWYDKGGNVIEESKATWWLGQRKEVNLMSMRVTYIKKGLSLPVTGGIGTFIFCVAGGALVIISMTAIITKIRIKRERLW